MTRPLIAVTTSRRSGWRIFPLVQFNLWLVGARAVRWGTGRSANLNDIDGLIIGGGDDVSPALYNGDMRMAARLGPERDELEARLAQQALAHDIPVLGICRGAQMLNIALGGTLYQEAWAAFPRSKPIKTILGKRDIHLSPGTHLAAMIGSERVLVNALHTQAVRELGNGLRVAGRDGGGMIQAIERKRAPYAVGVQWHPEHLFYRTEHRGIFSALVAAAHAHADGRDQIEVLPAEA